MDGTDYLARIDFFDYPFAPFTNESDPAILRIWAELRPYLYTRGYVIPEQIKSPWLCGVLYLAPDDHPIPYVQHSLIDVRGQVFVAVRQLLEGLAFMHSHNIAHGDICAQNIFYMSGTEFRDGVPAHSAPPSYFPRAWRPPRYFYLDFGFAVKLNPTSGRRTVYNGGYIEMPEVQGWETASEPLFYDPFAADVYCLAHTIKETTMMLLDWHEDPRLVAYPNGFIALLESMLHGDPAERPSADECLRRFNAEMQDVPRYKLLLPDAPLHDLPVIFRVDWKEATSYVCNALACLVFGMHGRVM
ncbi:kinase-like domain-containing protein [Schizophyllum amplum]|uniref:non-specific serine/threonine protein kinase n=1 Tax=Schizophyllum amplum TaxID=97359 RepID=A0A550BVS4_9AGAR|nr:kinase-like domain-containing protein [Auriculariopsis ampla]